MKNYLREYLNNRPLFISVIRHREAKLFEENAPFEGTVLDFGCGDGFFANLILTKDKMIDVGLDMDISELEEAKERNVYKKVIKYDGDKIPFDQDFFSTVISNCVLEHIPHIENSIGEIARVLQPGGKFITTVMTNVWEEYLFGTQILGDVYKNWMRKKQVHPSLLSSKQWSQLFEDKGFEIGEVIGYMDERSSKWMDMLHYCSVDSLVTKKLFDEWVVFAQRYDLLPVEKWIRSLDHKHIDPEKSAAVFYVLTKK